MSHIDAELTIRDPRAHDMRILHQPDIPLISLHLAGPSRVWFALGTHYSDREAEAAAMDRLADLATQAAALLRGGE